jgi:hypothetical protein
VHCLSKPKARAAGDIKVLIPNIALIILDSMFAEQRQKFLLIVELAMVFFLIANPPKKVETPERVSGSTDSLANGVPRRARFWHVGVGLAGL